MSSKKKYAQSPSLECSKILYVSNSIGFTGDNVKYVLLATYFTKRANLLTKLEMHQ